MTRALDQCDAELRAIATARNEQPQSDTAWHAMLDESESRLRAYARALSWALGGEPETRSLTPAEKKVFASNPSF